MKLVSVLKDPELTREFCELPVKIYREDHQRLAMNPVYCMKLLSVPMPFEKEAFLIQDHKGGSFGRILLQVASQKHLGHWSFLALSPELTEDNLREIDGLIKGWFSERKISELIGPYYFTTYFPYRMRIDQDPISYAWEPKQPHYELEFLLKMGHEIHEVYQTNLLKGFGHFETKGEREYERLISRGFRFQEIELGKMDDLVRVLYEMSMQAFKDNYLFEPIPFELFREIYIPSFRSVDLRLSNIQYSPDGKPAGFNFTFPDGNNMIIKSACVMPGFRGSGLFGAGIYHSVKKCRELFPQVTDVITALVHAQNAASKKMADSPTGFDRHEYALLRKVLA